MIEQELNKSLHNINYLLKQVEEYRKNTRNIKVLVEGVLNENRTN